MRLIQVVFQTARFEQKTMLYDVCDVHIMIQSFSVG